MEGRRGFAAALAAFVPLALCAQTGKLVNLDTGHVAAPGKAELKLNGRFFGGDEGMTYGTLELAFGLQPEWGAGIRGSFGRFKTFQGNGFQVRHGGSDLEAYVRYAPALASGLAITGGVSLPNTPAQDQAFATGSVVYALPIEASGSKFYIGARGVFRSDSTIVGIGGGFDAGLGYGLHLVGDVTGIVSGDNTYSTATGTLQRRAVWGVGLRYQTPTMSRELYDLSLEAGVTNGIGGTTGFSLTPSLGNSIGIYAGVTVRF